MSYTYLLLSIGIAAILIAIIRIRKEPRRFSNGILLTYGIISLVRGGYRYWYHASPGLDRTGEDTYVVNSSGELQGLVVMLFYLLFVVLGIYLIISGIRLLRKERLSLTNLLPLGFGIFSLLFPVMELLIPPVPLSEDATYFILYYGARFLQSIGIYVPFMVLAYFLYSLVYKIIRKNRKPDYIIVLGARIIGNRVSPLLAKRLDKGIELYHKYNETSKFVVSGGKGSDEVCSEAEAMASYLVEQGIPKEKIILEDRSVNTWQNLKFSKDLIEKDTSEEYYCAVVTNNFHMLRGAIFARSVGMPASGYGCKTAIYYYPAAALRESIAFIFSYKKLAFYVLGYSFIINLLNLIFTLVVY